MGQQQSSFIVGSHGNSELVNSLHILHATSSLLVETKNFLDDSGGNINFKYAAGNEPLHDTVPVKSQSM